MTEIVFDFADINRRVNRKPEPVAAIEPPAGYTLELIDALPAWMFEDAKSLANLRDALAEAERKFRIEMDGRPWYSAL